MYYSHNICILSTRHALFAHICILSTRHVLFAQYMYIIDETCIICKAHVLTPKYAVLLHVKYTVVISRNLGTIS